MILLVPVGAVFARQMPLRFDFPSHAGIAGRGGEDQSALITDAW
jgi:hypothetical protein